MKEELQNTRKDYNLSSLEEKDLKPTPVEQFEQWFSEYEKMGSVDYNAMVLSTINNSGAPVSRVVLLKGLHNGGFEFYTNYDSHKGQDIEKEPRVALNFFWPLLERQVRVEGVAHKLTQAESDQYFNSRPLGSRLGAWASPQSRVIRDRGFLENRLEEVTEKYGEQVPRPANWGGYRVMPQRVEFWQGRRNRLHDRLVYLKAGNNWKIERLAP